MKYETRRFIESMLMNYQKYHMYGEFRRFLAEYKRLAWWHSKLPVLTFAIGIILGILIGKLP